MSQTTSETTVLGSDAWMSGQLILDGNAVISGRIDGGVRLGGELELPQTAQICGTLLVGRLQLSGRVEADVIATESAQLLPGAQLTGRIYTPQLLMGQDVIFKGEAVVGPDAISAAQEMLNENDQTSEAQWLTEQLNADPAIKAPSTRIEDATGPTGAPQTASHERQIPSFTDLPTTHPVISRPDLIEDEDDPQVPSRPDPASGTHSVRPPDATEAATALDRGTVVIGSPETADADADQDEAQKPPSDIETVLNSVQAVLRRRRAPKVLRTDPPEEAA